MSRIFITGSADGLGLLAAKSLIEQKHQVVMHARNAKRAKETKEKVPQAEDVLVGDLADIEETKRLASDVNAMGYFDAVIHNAGVYQVSPQTILTVNTLAPYLLTAMINRPVRLVYLSSGMHLQGSANVEKMLSNPARVSYSDSKLHMVILALAVARKRPETYSNAVDPGWVPTKMGGLGAPDDLQKGFETQVWLAASDEAAAKVSGRYFFHKKERRYKGEAAETGVQDKFLRACGQLTGIQLH